MRILYGNKMEGYAWGYNCLRGLLVSWILFMGDSLINPRKIEILEMLVNLWERFYPRYAWVLHLSKTFFKYNKEYRVGTL